MSRYTKRRREEDGGLMTEEEKMRRFMEEAEEEEGKDVESIPMTAKQKEAYIASMLASKRAKAAEVVEKSVELNDNPFAEGNLIMSFSFLSFD